MAYIQKRDEDERSESIAPQDALNRSSMSGVLGANPQTAASPNPQMPSSSGSNFVNLQRYLERNPMTDVGGKINEFANMGAGQAYGDYAKASVPYEGWNSRNFQPSVKDYNKDEIQRLVDASDNDTRAGMELSPVLRGTQGNSYPGKFNYEPGPELKRRSGIIDNPYVMRGGQIQDPSDPKKSIPSPTSLPYEFALDKSVYTPGQETLDMALFQSKGDVNKAIAEGKSTLANVEPTIKGFVDNINKYGQGIQDNYAAQTANAKGVAQQILDPRIEDFALHGVPEKFQRLAAMLGFDVDKAVSDWKTQNPGKPIEGNGGQSTGGGAQGQLPGPATEKVDMSQLPPGTWAQQRPDGQTFWVLPDGRVVDKDGNVVERTKAPQ